MNLYDLHNKPESLHKRKEADEQVAEVIWSRFPHNSEKLKQYEDILAKDARIALAYSHWVLGKEWPKGEKAIANSKFAYDYWKFVINRDAGVNGTMSKRFPAGEKAIARIPSHAIQYTMNTKHAIPEFEATLIDDPKKIAAVS